jgi:sulfur carrier protein ThiS
MKVVVKLYAMLEKYLPPGAVDNQVATEVAPGATVGRVLASFGLPPEMCHLVLVNGLFVPPSERPARALADGDHLADRKNTLPRVRGGGRGSTPNRVGDQVPRPHSAQ